MSVHVPAAGGRRATWTSAVLATLGMFGLYWAIQLLTAVLAFHRLLPSMSEPVHGSWPQLVDHHVWQMAAALVLIGVLSHRRFRAWGLNFRNREESLRIVRRFVRIYGVYFVGIGMIVQLLLLPAPQRQTAVAPGEIAGRLAFGFLFVGLSEEILSGG